MKTKVININIVARLPRLFRGAVAVVGGRLIGLPVTGRFLARYFLGLGGTVALPRALVPAIAYAIAEWEPCLDNPQGPFHPGAEWTLLSGHCPDLGTSLGRFWVRENGVGDYDVVDTYEFWENIAASAKTKILGWYILVTANDLQVAPWGKPFRIEGMIPRKLVDAVVVEDYEDPDDDYDDDFDDDDYGF